MKRILRDIYFIYNRFNYSFLSINYVLTDVFNLSYLIYIIIITYSIGNKLKLIVFAFPIYPEVQNLQKKVKRNVS